MRLWPRRCEPHRLQARSRCLPQTGSTSRGNSRRSDYSRWHPAHPLTGIAALLTRSFRNLNGEAQPTSWNTVDTYLGTGSPGSCLSSSPAGNSHVEWHGRLTRKLVPNNACSGRALLLLHDQNSVGTFPWW